MTAQELRQWLDSLADDDKDMTVLFYADEVGYARVESFNVEKTSVYRGEFVIFESGSRVPAVVLRSRYSREQEAEVGDARPQ
jgi:hypothetical protein